MTLPATTVLVASLGLSGLKQRVGPVLPRRHATALALAWIVFALMPWVTVSLGAARVAAIAFVLFATAVGAALLVFGVAQKHNLPVSAWVIASLLLLLGLFNSMLSSVQTKLSTF